MIHGEILTIDPDYEYIALSYLKQKHFNNGNYKIRHIMYNGMTEVVYSMNVYAEPRNIVIP